MSSLVYPASGDLSASVFSSRRRNASPRRLKLPVANLLCLIGDDAGNRSETGIPWVAGEIPQRVTVTVKRLGVDSLLLYIHMFNVDTKKGFTEAIWLGQKG